jgi:ABC-2 type transport system permease protein
VTWALRIAISKLRPFNVAAIARIAIVAAVFGAFLYGDYRLFAQLFKQVQSVEAATPFFALGLLRNLLAMVFLIASVVLFSSAMTAAIGAFFSDLDLDIYHSAPRGKLRIALSRWSKTLFQSATIVFAFLVPLFVAFARTYPVPPSFYAAASINLLLLLTIPISLASCAIILLVRFFPVRHVHQIVATIAMLVLTGAVIAFRMSRPERFFVDANTDDVVRVLRAIELPSMSVYPSTALAEWMTWSAGVSPAPFGLVRTAGETPALQMRIVTVAVIAFLAFVATARLAYFAAFVRARETMAPVALGSRFATRIIDRALAPFDIQTRALVAKEVRTLARDVAQWSQLFLMGALLFIYLYNVRMLPLGGDARATIVAYANLGMAGFVIAAICLRFAYPSVSAEGKAFWLIQSAPMSYRRFLAVKVAVYSVPLTLLALLLTVFANVILAAQPVVWAFTLLGASLLAITLVSLGVGLGAVSPNFAAENPLQVGLSLGGFAYMAVSLGYVGAIMFLMARPVVHYFLWRFLGITDDHTVLQIALPAVTAVTLSIALMVFPLVIAERRLSEREK